MNFHCISRREIDSVFEIEQQVYEYPWTRKEIEREAMRKSVAPMFATVDGMFAGYFFYELRRKQISLINLTVAPMFQRQGVGTAIINNLKGKLSRHSRSQITFIAAESNLDACLFLKAMGFWATHILKDYFEESGDDGYLFGFRCPR